MDALDRMFARLIHNLRHSYPELLGNPFEVAEVYQTLIPYRHNRRELALDSNHEYELAVMALLSGARGYLVGEGRMQETLRAELSSPNPDSSLFRTFATSRVAVATDALRRFDSPGESGAEEASASGRPGERSVSSTRLTDSPPVREERWAPRSEPARSEPARAEPRSEPLRAEPIRSEPQRAQPPRADQPREEPPRPEPAQAQPEVRAHSFGVLRGAGAPPPAPRESPELRGESARHFDTSRESVREIAREPAREPTRESRTSTPNSTPARPMRSASPQHSSRSSHHQPAMSAPNPTPSRSVTASTVGGSCRYCGGTLPDGRRIVFCPHCGQNLTIQHCPACSTELELGWKFCTTCGRSVASA